MTDLKKNFLDAIWLALGDDVDAHADELRRVSSAGTTISQEGLACRNVLRNIANILDGTWETVPGSVTEAFEIATVKMEAALEEGDDNEDAKAFAQAFINDSLSNIDWGDDEEAAEENDWAGKGWERHIRERAFGTPVSYHVRTPEGYLGYAEAVVYAETTKIYVTYEHPIKSHGDKIVIFGSFYTPEELEHL